MNEDRTLHAPTGDMEGSTATWHYNIPSENIDTIIMFKSDFLKRFEANNTNLEVLF